MRKLALKFSQKCDGEIKCGRNRCGTAVTAFDFDILLRFPTGIGSTEQEEQIGNKLTTSGTLFSFSP